MAQQVVNRGNSPVESGQPLRRMGEEEDEELLQGKRMADSIQRQDELEEEEEELQPKLAADSVQRQELPEEEEEELQPKSNIQRQATTNTEATPELEESIQQARGGGQALPEDVRTPMERTFGANFSRVKVHTDTRADQLNQSIQARAFTSGQDIFMRQGEYSPSTRSGQELLAHELTHVVQQNRDVAT